MIIFRVKTIVCNGNQVADTGIRVQLGEAGDNKPNQVGDLFAYRLKEKCI